MLQQVTNAVVLRQGHTVTSAVTGAKYATPPVVMRRHERWLPLYHKDFFRNCLQEHLRKIKGYDVKRAEELRIRLLMAQMRPVVVNNIPFRFKQEKNHVQRQEDQQAA